MKKIHFLIRLGAAIGLFVAAAIQSNQVFARALEFSDVQETGNRSITLEELGYLEDETIQGVTASRSFGFHWPASWAVLPGNTVTVQFSHSPMLAEYSSMAVDINFVRIGSVPLTPETADHGQVLLEIPAKLIQPGYNSLTLEFYMGIHTNYCEDAENPGVWVTIHNSSSFNLMYEPGISDLDLSRFPYPFLDNTEFLVNKINLVMPAKPNLAELDALTRISAKLGQLNSSNKMEIEVISEDQAQDQERADPGHFVYIGRSDHLVVLDSPELPFVKHGSNNRTLTTLDGRQIDPNLGVLWIDEVPGSADKARLIVTGKTDEALLLAGRAIANESAYPLLNGQLAIIKSITSPTEIVQPLEPKMVLEKLGYEDITTHGSYQQSVNYVVNLSREWQVLTEASFDLHFAHSELLQSQNSLLTLSVNNKLVGNTRLDENNAADAWITFRIPARLFKIGANELSLVMNPQLQSDPEDPNQCNDDHYYDAWVTVYSDSILTLPTGPTVRTLDLGNYPFGFMENADLSGTEFVVPASPNLDTAQALAWISSGLGRYTTGEESLPEVIAGGDPVAVEQAAAFQILLGEPSQNNSIYQLNDILPLSFIAGSNKPQNPELIPEVMPASQVSSIGYIEAAMTQDGYSRLVVTGNDAQGFKWAARALYDPELMPLLEGDLAILGSQDAIYADTILQAQDTRVETTSAAPALPREGDYSNPSARWIVWLAGAIFLITIVIISGTLISSTSKRKK